MEVEAPVLAPLPAVSPPAASPAKKALAAVLTSAPKSKAARRKTLCDITNLNRRNPSDSACPAAAPGAAGAEGFAQLLKARSPIP
nr:unnamed protein product [Digitaria exilis]